MGFSRFRGLISNEVTVAMHATLSSSHFKCKQLGTKNLYRIVLGKNFLESQEKPKIVAMYLEEL